MRWCSAPRPATRRKPRMLRAAAWSSSEKSMRPTDGHKAKGPRVKLGRVAPDDVRMSPALPQFEHVTRYWDDEHQVFAARLLPGEYYVTRNGELVTTVLGSCVSACVRDARLRIGGMNHFMLPLDG